MKRIRLRRTDIGLTLFALRQERNKRQRLLKKEPTNAKQRAHYKRNAERLKELEDVLSKFEGLLDNETD